MTETRGAIKPYGETMKMSRVDFARSVAGDGRQERLAMAHFHERWRYASWPRADCFNVELAVLQWLRSLCCCRCNDLEWSKFVCKATQSLSTHRGNMSFKEERKPGREREKGVNERDQRMIGKKKMEKQDKMGEVKWKREQRKANLRIHTKNSPLDLRPPQVLQKDINAKTKNTTILGLRWKAFP